MTTFTVEIQAGNKDGTVWQALEPAETIGSDAWGSDWTAEDIARIAADHQTLTTGGNWRVQVWHGTDADTGMKPAAEIYSSNPQDNYPGDDR